MTLDDTDRGEQSWSQTGLKDLAPCTGVPFCSELSGEEADEEQKGVAKYVRSQWTHRKIGPDSPICLPSMKRE